MATKNGKSKKNQDQAARRTLNPSPEQAKPVERGAPAQEQDPQRRLGNFSTAGEHPRTGKRHK